MGFGVLLYSIGFFGYGERSMLNQVKGNFDGIVNKFQINYKNEQDSKSGVLFWHNRFIEGKLNKLKRGLILSFIVSGLVLTKYCYDRYPAN